MIDEGYVKYQCHWIETKPLPYKKIAELNQWRDKLYQLHLIGMYENGIGFGNLSIRYTPSGEFIISGTKTGSLPRLTEHHYTIVTDFDLDQNSLTCTGPIQASSEALTHATLYAANPTINAIIHVHNLSLWQQLINQVPTTAQDCPYGTPEMAREILRLFDQENLMTKKILVMAGHEEGIITFGETLDEAGAILLNYYNGKVISMP